VHGPDHARSGSTPARPPAALGLIRPNPKLSARPGAVTRPRR